MAPPCLTDPSLERAPVPCEAESRPPSGATYCRLLPSLEETAPLSPLPSARSTTAADFVGVVRARQEGLTSPGETARSRSPVPRCQRGAVPLDEALRGRYTLPPAPLSSRRKQLIDNSLSCLTETPAARPAVASSPPVCLNFVLSAADSTPRSSSGSIGSYIQAAEMNIDCEAQSVQSLLAAKEDAYGGVIVDHEDLPVEPSDFGIKLRHSLQVFPSHFQFPSITRKLELNRSLTTLPLACCESLPESFAFCGHQTELLR